MDEFLKQYLPVYLIIYVVIIFVIPSVRVFKRTGINPVTFGKVDNAHNYIGRVMKVLVALTSTGICFFSFVTHLYQYLVPIDFLRTIWIQYIGLVLLHASLLWTIIAQYQMHDSWRIGIDQKNATSLVTEGLFQLSRNPIFLGMIVSTWAMFFVTPNALMLLVAFTTFIVIQIQIRLEEEYLVIQHGENYKAYMSTVRRIL